jgi:DNA polymerase III delta prime subunit
MNSASINQFLGRITCVERFGPSPDSDIRKLAGSSPLDKPALDALVQVAEGQARRAVALLANAKRNNGRQVDANAIHRAARRLMPVLEGNGGSP